jgi:single-stranded-DNA-specific exonuclease
MDGIRRFDIPLCPETEVRRLERELGASDPMAQALVRRGLGDPERARAFLAADEEHPPAAFAGIDGAIATILEHVASGARITVHGDYDVDGICSTAVLIRALGALGANVDWYLPDRASDGYGLNANTVRRLAARGTRLLVTADCAITAVEEVRLARELGVDVVVTDHHAPRADGALPRAPIVHPTVCGYPCPDLCATAVAYKLAQGLWQAAAGLASIGGGSSGDGDPSIRGARTTYDPGEDLDLVALATIADVVALVGENRTLVRRGLRALAGTAKPGLRALMAAARGSSGPARPVDERTVSFALAPRLNAAGRLYRADAGLELILTEDPGRGERIAAELDRANRERRHTEAGILFEAERQLAELDGRSPLARPAGYVLAGEGWHPGVIGIVASRLAERHHRPFVLVALEGESGRGSGRSIDSFDLLGALDACAGQLLRHGGHRAAAGLEIERSRLSEFAEAFASHAERALGAEDLIRAERVDAVVAGGELGMALAEELQSLAPFGRANPAVSLLMRDARFLDRRPMGEGRHVRFTVESDGPPVARSRAVAFGTGAGLPVRDGAPADATFTLEVNEYNGVSEPRLVLRHAQPAAAYAQPTTVAADAEPEASERHELVLFA